ncbi:dTDP-4-amino-4,6-dideoxygalactose transaminase [Bdellovibrio bacteriovorus]|uniref:dTDP-4-amino-4,6-dideoxygalactose transaminase n=1 Tax=Bdellovibrio bacteriovorus TaxID=959 RepID=A0A150WK91_BDEBC|nr:dTDP-4-amino-4,6-dideoxygalactose transaminase [Bdellovibrio bacteriovorus]KYG64043.1 dTDP-4-amino-4,6-dideoxygalactose transaminase [Bdellovibrio bacteriovorus]
MKIPFNLPPKSSHEEQYIAQAISNRKLSGEGSFNKKCTEWFNKNLPTLMTVITPSCTSALEMAMVLADIGPGDEVILPSFTFTSTANVVALYGAVPVFVDIDPRTLNIDPIAIEKAITPRTRVIMPVHYAGVGCEMDRIMALAEPKNIWVVEDAAQGIFASYKGKALGSWGHMAAFSFHETKNIVCGEGGALTINDKRLLARAEIVRDKGTNRQQFLNGQVDKYTWQDKGSSYLLSELSAAFLLSQLEEGPQITERRLKIWNEYNQGLAELEKQGHLTRMTVPSEAKANAHIYYILLNSADVRAALWQFLRDRDIQSTTHYVPLHSAPAGVKYGRISGSLKVTDDLANRMLRLPMFADLSTDEVAYVVDSIDAFFKR